MNMTVASEFLDQTRKIFLSQKALLDKTLEQLSDDDLFYQPDNESNSVAITLKHLGGNMVSRWRDFLTTDGEKSDRNRDSEFITDNDTAESIRALLER
jgi:hypothetical protein